MYSKIKYFPIIVLLFIGLQNCEQIESPLPEVPVNIQVDPTSLSLIGIGTAGYCPIYGGMKGIIIYHDAEQFYAFDRLCTNYPNDNEAINIDESKTTATCPSCGSQFSLYDGSIIKEPAKYALKQYQTSFNGTRLTITN